MTIDDYMAELSRIDDDAGALVAPLSDAQASWRPEEGRRWSVTQNLQHLAKINELYVAAMRRGLDHARPGPTADNLLEIPGWFGRWFVRVMEPPPRVRTKTRKIVEPPSTGTVRDALADFLKSQKTIRAFAREAARRNVRATFTSPFGPLRFRIGTGLLVLAAHDRRHLWQARQVIATPGFPTA